MVGARLTLAAGAGWSAKLRGTGQVAVAFFGDGATNIGAFHEALNIAAVWALPVLFICENNLYMEYTPIGSVTAGPNPPAAPPPPYKIPPAVTHRTAGGVLPPPAPPAARGAQARRRPDPRY